jgi:hypothetical protein
MVVMGTLLVIGSIGGVLAIVFADVLGLGIGTILHNISKGRDATQVKARSESKND